MLAHVIGSAAGGGVPQWNCRCPVCQLAWRPGGKGITRTQVIPRTQSSLAISADGKNWALLNASPDLRHQIIASKALHPISGLRHSPIEAVVLTNGDVDHIAGLLNLRESQPFRLYATETTLGILRSNSIFSVLNPDYVKMVPVGLGREFELQKGLIVTPFAAPGKVPLYLEKGDVSIGNLSESVLGLEIAANGKRMVYLPGCADITPDLIARLEGADLLFFDGTTFSDDEMPRLHLSNKTAHRMGHVAMSGETGSLQALARLKLGRKIYIHINNTNPVLIEDSPERAIVNAAGWEVAYDGMEMEL